MSGLVDEWRKQPPPNVGSMQAEARYRLESNLRRLENEARQLHGRLEAGAGLDATRPIYDHIGSLARDAREEGRKQLVPEPVQKRVDRAEELWAELTPYYGGGSGPDESK